MSKAEREAFIECAQWLNMPGGAEKEAFRRYPDSPLGNVREIVVAYLKDNGYDGIRDGNGCECRLNKPLNFMCEPNCPSSFCRPGVLVDGKIKEREKETFYEGLKKLDKILDEANTQEEGA